MILYTSTAQWGLFLGIGLILFGWIEKKRAMGIAGQGIFVVLGILALWILLSNQIVIETGGNMHTKETRILSFFTGMVACGIVGITSLILSYLNLRMKNLVKVILILFGIFLFFAVYHIQQS